MVLDSAHELPASRNSILRPASRIRRASSIRRPSDIFAILYRTRGCVSASSHTKLSCRNLFPVLSKRHIQFVVHRSLRPIVLESPLQPRIAVVELRNLRNHRRHVRPEQLLLLFA